MAEIPTFVGQLAADPMARQKEFQKQAYHEQPNCFSSVHHFPGAWREKVFQNDHPLILEMGCGKADFSIGMAERYPDKNFVGIDLKPDRLYHASVKAQRVGVQNVAFLYQHLMKLPEHLASGEVDELWITFPDPYPKKRQAKHRMVHPSFLELYRHLLKPGGLIHYKTDNQELFEYSLENFVRSGQLQLLQLSFDLHNDGAIGEDAKIITAYERKFLEMEQRIHYASMQFLPQLP